MRRDRRGNIALMTALVALPLVGFTGVAVDGARAWLLRSRLISATDSAALAGARSLDQPATQRDREIRGMFWANAAGSGACSDTVATSAETRAGFMGACFALDAPVVLNANTVRVTAKATVKTSFVSLVGIRDFTVNSIAEAKRADPQMELALVMDVSGGTDGNCPTPSDRTFVTCAYTPVPTAPNSGTSPRDNNMDRMRLAAAELVLQLFGTRESVPGLYVSVVPYASTVNFGPGRVGWLTGYDPANYAPTSWRGCVEARTGYAGAPPNGDLTDDPPTGAGQFRPFFSRSTLNGYRRNTTIVAGDNDWAPRLWNASSAINSDVITEDAFFFRGNYVVGPNIGCPTSRVLPLSGSRSAILSTIDGLRPAPRGGAMANLGLQAGWFTLSPRWRDSWGLTTVPIGQDTALPLNYEARRSRKVMVLIVGGENQWTDSFLGFPGRCLEDAFAPSFPTSGAPGPAQAVRPRNCNPPGVTTDATAVSSAFPPVAGNADYTAYGRRSDNRLGAGLTTDAAARIALNERTRTMCNTIKNAHLGVPGGKPIEVYTIVLSAQFTTFTPEFLNLYQGCASNPGNFRIVNTPSDLGPTFLKVVNDVSSVRLSR